MNTTLNITPGQAVFQHDMIMRTKHLMDWEILRNKKMRQIEKSNLRENASRVYHNYKLGDLVLLTHGLGGTKMNSLREGPYKIVKLGTQGSHLVRRGCILEPVSIRRLTPYFS